ncbi:MAG: metallophosphoesterase family protein [Candidatus Methanodesulfokora sp.]
MRIVHIADTHLGKRQYGILEREHDLYNAFDEAVEKIVRMKPDIVIHSGDIFDSYKPAPWTLLRAVNGIMRIVESGALFVAVQGNHDLGPSPEGGKDSPFPLLERIFGEKFVYLGKKRPSIEFGDVVICGIPYHPASMRKQLITSMEEVSKRAGNNGFRIMVLHQGISPFLVEYKTEIHKADIERFPFDYFALGHYHNRKEHSDGRRIYVYPGSTENIEEREVEESKEIGKGFFLLDTDGEKRDFVRLERIRPYHIIKRRISSIMGIDSLMDDVRRIVLSERIPPMIRIRASTREDLMDEINKAHKDLMDELEGKYLRIFLDLTSEETDKMVEGASSLDIEVLLRDMFKERELERELGIEIYRAFREGKRGDDLRNFVMRKLERWLNEANIS